MILLPFSLSASGDASQGRLSLRSEARSQYPLSLTIIILFGLDNRHGLLFVVRISEFVPPLFEALMCAVPNEAVDCKALPVNCARSAFYQALGRLNRV
jgi:hypothetical protein